MDARRSATRLGVVACTAFAALAARAAWMALAPAPAPAPVEHACIDMHASRGRILDRHGAPLAIEDENGVRRYALGPTRVIGGLEHGVGTSGIEATYERALAGEPGRLCVPRTGRRELPRVLREPMAGEDVVTTLAAELQRAIERTFTLRADREAAAVVLDARSGAVRALVSHAGPDAPLDRDVDLAIGRAMPMGSAGKLASAAAALELGIDPHPPVRCNGSWAFAEGYGRCTGEHGEVDLEEAIASGDYAFFYAHAAEVGAPRLADVQARLGFGSASGIDLPGEASGSLVPREGLSALELAVAFGGHEDAVRATPLQAAVAYATLLEGRLVRPFVVGPPREARATDVIAPAHRALLLSALSRTVRGADGRLRERLDARQVHGATVGHSFVGELDGDEPLVRANWMVALVPAEEPRFVVVVLSSRRAGETELGQEVIDATVSTLGGDP